MKRHMKKTLAALCCLAVAIGAFSGCGQSQGAPAESEPASAAPAAAGQASEPESETAAGGEITVMLPPWAEPSPELLQEFTDESGIKVILNVVGWDDIRNKISIASVGQAAVADVVEVDWSWVGEFGAAGWMEPLDVDAAVQESMPPISSFIYDGQVLAVPYSNDFRIAFYNKEHFEAAGVTEPPATWDEVIEDVKKVKEAGICEYPLSLILSATEPTTNTMLWLTNAKYGPFFNDDMSVNHDNVLNTLNFVNGLVNVDKLVDPASLNMKDTEVDGKMMANSSSFMVAAIAYNERLDDPEQSQVVDKTDPILVPGSEAVRSATFALPEGLGIPKYAVNKEAGKKFIDWYTAPETQIKLYGEQGNIPTSNVALEKMMEEGTLKDGETVIEQTTYISSPFPGGIPEWYSEMSNAVYNNVNQMVQGSITPEQALAGIEDKVNELRG